MICIYHSKDLDGYCSGAIVKHKYPEAKLIGYDYGQPFPWDDIPEGSPVVMIDVSLPMEDMAKLAKHSGYKFTWVDHHISAINDYKAFVGEGESFCTAVLENGRSACEGGWKHFFPLRYMPAAVKVLGKYDTWRNEDKNAWDNEIMPFQYGMRMICNSPETFPEILLSQNNADTTPEFVNILEIGKNILAYQKSQNERACRSAFEVEFEGLRGIALNNGGANSQVFDSVYDPEKHDVMIPFVFTGKHWTFSLYTTKDEVDCSVVAKSKGGGGHKKAAGFQLKELPSEFLVHITD